MLLRHYHADLPVIFLGEIIFIIRLFVRNSLSRRLILYRMHLFRSRILRGGVFLRRLRNIRSSHILSGILRFRRLPGRLLIDLSCIFRLLICRFRINLLLWCAGRSRCHSCSRRLPFLHQLLHARGELFLQIDGIVFSYIHGFHLDVHFLSLRSRLFPGALFRRILLQLLRHLQPLSAHHVGVKLLLLGRRKRLMKRLELHGLHHIFPFSKPENQLVTFLYALGRKPHPMIQIRQLIGPFFPIILLFEFLKNSNPFLKPHILRLIELILKDISSGVVRRDLHKILVIFNRMDHIAHPDGQIAERIYDHSPGGMSLICHLKQELRVLKPPVHLVYVADGTEHHNALHPRPVNRIRNFCRFRIFFLRNQRLYFLSPYLIFIFIQGCHLCHKLICERLRAACCNRSRKRNRYAHYIF